MQVLTDLKSRALVIVLIPFSVVRVRVGRRAAAARTVFFRLVVSLGPSGP